MNDFEIQRTLRQLNAPRMPRTDLWPAIAARIDAEADTAQPTRRRHGSWLPLAAAAGVLLAVAAGLLLPALQPGNTPQDFAAAAIVSAQPSILRMSPTEARDAAVARGSDPRVAGAAVVLDAAQAELAQALEQHPDAVFLVSLLNRTNAQRMKLDRFGARAG